MAAFEAKLKTSKSYELRITSYELRVTSWRSFEAPPLRTNEVLEALAAEVLEATSWSSFVALPLRSYITVTP